MANIEKNNENSLVVLYFFSNRHTMRHTETVINPQSDPKISDLCIKSTIHKGLSSKALRHLIKPFALIAISLDQSFFEHSP